MDEYLLAEEVTFSDYTVGVLSIEALLISYWLHFRFHYPKRSKGHLGLVIGVRAENSEQRKYLEADFLLPLKSRIQGAKLPFDVLELKQHQTEAIEGDIDAQKALIKTKAQFILWGAVKKRKNRYVFELRGMVVHRSVEQAQQILLISEFNLLLPHILAFEEAFQPEYFGFRAEQSYASIDYITGRAALLSGDFITALKLHEPLVKDTERGLITLPIPQDRLRKILSLEYGLKAEAMDGFSNPDEFKSNVEKALKYNPHNYGALLRKAIIEFEGGNGDPRKALEIIKEAKRYTTGGEWRYSKIFLHFWLEDYENALRECKLLKEKKYACDSKTPDEIISYNENLLKKCNKPQLYYWIGFVAYEKKGNFSLADTYFQKFIDTANEDMEVLKESATAYLVEIKETIKY